MKKSLTLVIALSLFLIGTAASAQNGSSVKGQVFEKSSGFPLAWATVAISRDSTIITGTACDENGKFSLSAPEGKYTLVFSMVGYIEQRRDLTMGKGTLEFPAVYMEEDAQMLQGARLVERERLVEMKIDKLVMNVGQSAFAQGSNGYELIKKAPGVTIDKDGNIKLNGKSVEIWIDGRPSHLDGKSLEALLRGTNGESIDKFELISNPSAKYDAQGQGGIINIKTKRNALQGLNGSVSANAGGMYYGDDYKRWIYRHGESANLNYRSGKVNTFLNLNEEKEVSYAEFNMTSKINKLSSESESILKLERKYLQARTGMDWSIDKKNTIGFIVGLPVSKDITSSPRKDNRSTLSDGLKELYTESEILNDSRGRQLNANLNFTHIFSEAKASEITANFDYYSNRAKSDNSQKNHKLEGGVWTELPGTKYGSDNYVDLYSAKADYQSLIFGFAMLESGAKWSSSKTYNKDTQAGTPGEVYNYSENIGALYASVGAQLGPKLSLKMGVRGEYTDANGDWANGKRQYFDLFPTVFAGYNPSEKFNLGLSYTRRINRPSYWQLSSSKNFVDSKTYIVGNPQLQPEYNNSVSMNMGMGRHFSLYLVGDFTKGSMTQKPELADGGSSQVMKWINYGRRDMGILGFTMSELALSKWLSWTLSLNGMYMNNKFDDSSSTLQNNEGFTGSGYTTFSFLLPKDWKVQLDAYGSLPMAYGYFKLKSMYGSSLAVKKNLLDNKLVLSLNISELFHYTDMNVENLVEKGNSDLKQRFLHNHVRFGISYSFGNSGQSRRRNVGTLEEAGRMGGGSGSISTGK